VNALERLIHGSALALAPPNARQPSETTPVSRKLRISFSTTRELASLKELAAEWCAMFAKNGAPHQVFQSYDWVAIWAGIYLDKKTSLAIITARIDNRLVLIWPLVLRRIFGLRILTCLGEPVSQYGDALIAPELGQAGEEAVLDYLMTLPVDVISLRRVRDDAALSDLLHRRFGAPTGRQSSPFIDFSGIRSVKDFEARFPGKLRSSRRRRRRRLGEVGEVAITHHVQCREIAPLISAALGLKREWARRNGIIAPALHDPRFEQFFAALAGAENSPVNLHVSVLRCASEIVGIDVSVACKDRLFGHVLATRPDLAALGIGGILVEAKLHYALERGFAAFDMLAPTDRYKMEWTSTTIGVADYSLPLTPLGFLYDRLWLRSGRHAMKALSERVRVGIINLRAVAGRKETQ
jgi:CelD/BcsL family acetyltransferase involved in cellulose biosynthesis